MRIKSCEFKNFASYGNRIQKIDFTDSTGDLYLILGNNGAGKSSLAKVITYLCYGKVEGTNLKDLPNRVNNNLWGKIEIESKGNLIEIERGINPSVFTAKINGADYDVAGKSNMQEFLETEMYEIPYHVFKNVIILSVNDFKSFITMSPHDKKKIVDRIFGFSVINDMKDIVKKRRRDILDQLKTLEDEIRTLDDSIESVTKKLDEFKANKDKESKEQVETLQIKIKDFRANQAVLVDAGKNIRSKITEYDVLFRDKSNTSSLLIHNIQTIKKDLSIYKNQQCPTCMGPLDSEFHIDIKKTKVKELVSISNSYEEIKKEVDKLDETISKYRNQSRQILSRSTKIDTDLKQLVAELKKLASNDNSDSSHLKDLVIDFEKRLDDKKTGKLSVEGDDYYLTILESIMGDDGIKNLAVRSILPSFNNHILLMSKEMGIPFIIKFDEKFNCELAHLGEEISPKTLSTGERKKVDFVIIMALIKMIKVRFPSLNLLFLDEIFSSVDASGVYHIIGILHKMIQDIGINTFVINHTVLPSEFFDKKIEISKDSGFSEFVIEDII